jgi:hypothetical protein
VEREALQEDMVAVEMGGSDGGTNSANTDPCSAGKTTTVIAKDSNYTSAINSIMTASADGNEHGITLGKDAYGNITKAPMKDGGTSSVPVNTTWPGAFAALHNHPTETTISGDIYTAVTLNAQNDNFTSSFIVFPDGSTYSIVVTDLAAAKAFVANYPADQLPNANKEFPDSIFYEIEDLKPYMGYSMEDKITAMGFVLNKHNAGITLLKQDIFGTFNPLMTNEITQPDGTKTYSPKNCIN